MVMRSHTRLFRKTRRVGRNLLPVTLAVLLALAPSRGAEADASPKASAPHATAVTDGLALIEQQRLAEAQAVFEGVLAREPRNLEATYQLGVLALRRSEAEMATDLLEKARALDPDAARTHHNLGHAYGLSAARASVFSKLGLARKCLASYQRAVELAPQHVEYRLSLIRYYQAAPSIAGGGAEKALAAAEALRALDPVRGSLTVIGVHVSGKQWSAAFAEVDHLRAQHPALRDADYQVGRLAALSDQRQQEGIAALRRFLDAPPQPGDTPATQAQFRLGMILEKMGQSAEARSAYRAALAADPNHPLAREALARLDDKTPSA
jgi:tetratricopeptide (TPR) repeat protein